MKRDEFDAAKKLEQQKEKQVNEFMLILKGDDSAEVSPAKMQERMTAYMAWMKEMTDEGRLVSGAPLEPRGAWLNADAVVTDGPFLEPKEIIGGYVILRAVNLQEAVALANACPLRQHCEVYVRPLLEVPAA